MSDRRQTYVIAEAGSCHDGDFGKAKALVAAAQAVGASAVKFQFWSSADRMAARRRADAYRAVYARYQVPRGWLGPLALHAQECGVDFLCSTYLPEDVATVAPFVPRFKVSSFEAENVPHLEAHLPYLVEGRRDVIVSLGLGASVSTLLRVFGSPTRFKALHCVSAYPTPAGQLRMRRVTGLDGFSDHASHEMLLSGAYAVMAGATIVEKHLRLPGTDDDNPDAGEHALDPRQFRSYVALLRHAEQCYGAVGGAEAEDAMRGYKVAPEAQ